MKKSGPGDRRIFSFEYAIVTFKNGKKTVKEKAWHYHLGNPNVHYVFRWNGQYIKGYTFTGEKKYMWVW
ncbi:hypothetical protein B1B04_17040 [Lysinibacillus sp. KCTC 33748]|uniref:hypothetical protein n=1 Tax=unclassified Lysinibacillus TaxID=2636778 RepID=UPI0009A5D7EC|nr:MULTISPECIES: hypothetical protein [unclassified Lysinibacillus]OXS72209.1 hypothetical protein B1B04_17040 [Lysinibacillus sp. KCTC 33748]